jgi:putative transposase
MAAVGRRSARIKSQTSAERFLSVHAAVYNTFYTQRHLTSRSTLKVLRRQAHSAWKAAVA